MGEYSRWAGLGSVDLEIGGGRLEASVVQNYAAGELKVNDALALALERSVWISIHCFTRGF